VTRAEAESLGLATPNGNSFILRADDTTTLSPGGKGRNSFRIISNNRYGTHVSVWVVHFAFLVSPHVAQLFMIGGGCTVSTCNTCRRVVGESV
jgi:hypothetical protein